MNNLINGQKPEFGNPEHIKWLKDRSAIMNGEINFSEIAWEEGIYIDGGENTKPRHKWPDDDRFPEPADCLVAYIKCPRCERHHKLLYCFDNMPGLRTEELIRIDLETDEGFACWNCGLEMYTEDRLVYVKKEIIK